MKIMQFIKHTATAQCFRKTATPSRLCRETTRQHWIASPLRKLAVRNDGHNNN
jgi:hypothetical protein